MKLEGVADSSGAGTARWYTETVDTQPVALAEASRIADLGVLVMHGEDDGLADPEPTKQFFANLAAQDKELKLWPGARHELLNEVEKEQVREHILETHWSTANHVEGYLYGFSGRHESEARLTCVELETGEVLWRWASYLGRGSMTYSDGHFITLGERGDLSLLELSPRGHREVRRLPGVLRSRRR